MKLEDYLVVETTLSNVLDSLNEMVEVADTSKHSESESNLMINEWNIELNEVILKLNSLQKDMIFTFKIEEEPTK